MAFLDTNAKRARQAVEKEEKLLGDLGSYAEISLGKAESLEVLGRLHALEVERFYERRRLEWRLAFTLWLGLAGVGAIVVNNLSEDAHGWWVFGASVVFAVLISVLHALFQWRAIVPGAVRGRNIGYAMSNLERKSIGLEPTYPAHTYRKIWSHYWLPMVTAILSGAIVAASVMKVVA